MRICRFIYRSKTLLTKNNRVVRNSSRIKDSVPSVYNCDVRQEPKTPFSAKFIPPLIGFQATIFCVNWSLVEAISSSVNFSSKFGSLSFWVYP
ncbi:hypothetical protein EUTSA_v10015140mg [Eutrema salsugineum]|uniref:Uncharacterized protein n=1 Tax=Eutrema salsugineum TaxID=72664 RepID=V4KR77_EUTSA|nr:hypothetical protein EUTSA_v10015140mg [Eutrema salsugineum]